MGTSPATGIHPDELLELRYSESLRTIQPVPAPSLVVDEWRRICDANDIPVIVKQLGDLVALSGEVRGRSAPVVFRQGGTHIDTVVAGDLEDLSGLVQSLQELTEDGHEVDVLVPLARMGEAHAACQTSGVQGLRAYWLSGDAVVFGRTEIP